MIVNQYSQSTDPQPRHGLSLNMYDYCIYLFGGIKDVTRERNDMHLYDTRANKWVSILPNLSSTSKVSAMEANQNVIQLPRI